MPTARTRSKKKQVVKRAKPATQAKALNPTLEPLAGLVGQWDMELSNASFLPDPSAKVQGHVSFEWVQDGAFLVMRMGTKPPKAPDAIWLIGRDDSAEDYTVLYYDSRQVSRVYHMSYSDGVWKMWRESPDFSQRFEGKVADGGRVISAKWEKSTDGVTWEHDFDVKYSKRS